MPSNWSVNSLDLRNDAHQQAVMLGTQQALITTQLLIQCSTISRSPAFIKDQASWTEENLSLLKVVQKDGAYKLSRWSSLTSSPKVDSSFIFNLQIYNCYAEYTT